MRDGGVHLRRALAAALEARRVANGWPQAVLVVDDGSADPAACERAVQSAGDAGHVRLVRLVPGRGPAAARNAGARAAAAGAADVLVFVDADVLLPADAFRLLRAVLARLPAGSAGAFGSYDARPESRRAAGRFRNLLHHWVHQRSAGPVPTFWAGLGFLRADAFTEAGGFDESYERPSIEDIELGLRLTDAGRRILLAPELQGRHLKDWTLAEMIATDFRGRAVPWTLLSLRRGRFPSALNLMGAQRAAALAAVAVPVCAALAPWLPAAGLGAVAGAAAVGWLNRGFYAFVARAAGPGVGAAALPLHLVHYWTAAAGLLAGTAVYLVGSRSGIRVRGGHSDGRAAGSSPPG